MQQSSQANKKINIFAFMVFAWTFYRENFRRIAFTTMISASIFFLLNTYIAFYWLTFSIPNRGIPLESVILRLVPLIPVYTVVFFFYKIATISPCFQILDGEKPTLSNFMPALKTVIHTLFCEFLETTAAILITGFLLYYTSQCLYQRPIPFMGTFYNLLFLIIFRFEIPSFNSIRALDNVKLMHFSKPSKRFGIMNFVYIETLCSTPILLMLLISVLPMFFIFDNFKFCAYSPVLVSLLYLLNFIVLFFVQSFSNIISLIYFRVVTSENPEIPASEVIKYKRERVSNG